jgi:hypothetical protein
MQTTMLPLHHLQQQVSSTVQQWLLPPQQQQQQQQTRHKLSLAGPSSWLSPAGLSCKLMRVVGSAGGWFQCRAQATCCGPLARSATEAVQYTWLNWQ